MSQSVSAYLTQDHRDCDEVFAELENLVINSDFTAAKDKYETFYEVMEKHFQMEEKVMFPQFEQITGMTAGPTQVMRMEHEQMRNVMGQMMEDLSNEDKNHFLGLSETLMILIQQHNMKEEQMLYNMADRAFGANSGAVVEEMKALEI